MTIAVDREAKGEEHNSFYRLSAGVVAFASFAGGTSAVGHQPMSLIQTAQYRVGSTSQIFGNEYRASVSVPSALAELRRRGALTWDDLAKIFGVSRRAVHLWASGERLSVFNDVKVRDLHAKVRERKKDHPAQIREYVLSSYGVVGTNERVTNQPVLKTAIVETSSAPLVATPTATKRYARGKARQA